MQRWRGLESVPGGWGRSVVTIGVFDGVHRGHQAIIGHAVKRARDMGLQSVVMTTGAELEAFALEGAKADDQLLASVYQKAGAKVYDLSDASVKRWQTVARDTAWKDFAERNERSAKMMKLAEQTL